MSMVQRLIDQLQQRGLHIAPGTERGTLLLCGPTEEKTPEVLDAVRKFKPHLLKMYESPVAEDPDHDPQGALVPTAELNVEICRVCGANVSDADTRALLASPTLCDRHGAREVKSKTTGTVVHEAVPRCPYKPGAA